MEAKVAVALLLQKLPVEVVEVVVVPVRVVVPAAV
jgi:hypothetical protein